MKPITKTALALSIVFFLTSLTSCMKERNEKTEYIVLNETVSAGKSYKLNLERYAAPGNTVIISRQAVNYTVSEVSKSNNSWEYTFSKNALLKAGVNDKEQVVLKISDNNTKCLYNQEKVNITINFTIQ